MIFFNKKRRNKLLALLTDLLEYHTALKTEQDIWDYLMRFGWSMTAENKYSPLPNSPFIYGPYYMDIAYRLQKQWEISRIIDNI